MGWGIGHEKVGDLLSLSLSSSPNPPLCTCIWTRVNTNYSWTLVPGVGEDGQMLVGSVWASEERRKEERKIPRSHLNLVNFWVAIVL